jgi:Ni,Fe-hydrogenase III small subunit
MINTLSRMFRTGILTEPLEPHLEPRTSNLEPSPTLHTLHQNLWAILGRALCIRHVDAGSCNACELEIHALNNPYYNLEGIGIKFVASPRHADLLLVTGPVSVNMEEALRRTYDAIPNPKLVVAIGDCATCGGIFSPASDVVISTGAEQSGEACPEHVEGTPAVVFPFAASATAPSYATRGPIAAVIPVDHTIPGCPPTPAAILTGLLEALTAAAS